MTLLRLAPLVLALGLASPLHAGALLAPGDPPAQNEALVAAERFPFRLLSDGDRRPALAVGAADSPARPVARRISYLVGPDGKVRAVYGSVTPASHARDVLADLTAAK